MIVHPYTNALYSDTCVKDANNGKDLNMFKTKAEAEACLKEIKTVMEKFN